MTFKRSFSPADAAASERRSGLNRRWIKTPYDGVDRRTGKDRRNDAPAGGSPEARSALTRRPEDFESVLLSNMVRLEALVRLLEDKGLISTRELADAIRAIQSDFEALDRDTR